MSAQLVLQHRVLGVVSCVCVCLCVYVHVPVCVCVYQEFYTL